MTNLKIAFITNNYKPHSGGVVSSIESFSQELIKLGHQVYIITLDFKNNKESDHDYVVRLSCPIKFMYKNRPFSLPISPTRNIVKLLKELEIDIIHSHHPFLLGKSASTAARRLSMPIVFTNHTQYREYAHNIPIPTTISKPIAEKLALDYCKKMDHIIAPSQSTLKYLKSKNIKTDITVIPSGINNIFFQKKEMCNSEKTKLLSVSRFTKEKNIPFLIETFAELDQTKFKTKFSLTLVGYGPELESLKNLAQNLNVLNNIEFVIAPSKDLLAKIYKKSDIFIFASQSETQGIVLAEAMASSLPIISLCGPGQDDIIIDSINGYLVNTKHEMLEKIQYLSGNKKLLINMSYAAHETSKLFDSSTLTTKLLEIYKSLIE